MKNLRKIVEAATSGPWVLDFTTCEYSGEDYIWRVVRCKNREDTTIAIDADKDEDFIYISTFNPQTVSAMLDVIEAADKYIYDIKTDKYKGFIGPKYEHYKAYEQARARLDELLK